MTQRISPARRQSAAVEVLRRGAQRLSSGGLIVSTPLHMAAISVVLISAGIVVSGLIGVVNDGRDLVPMLAAGIGTGLVGLTLWRISSPPAHVSHTSALATVAWSWVAVSIAGAVPYLVTGAFSAPLDAFFESMSGFSCSGSTLFGDTEGMKGLEDLSKGLLFWRQLTQWFGGMGVVVLAVAVLPLLGVGGLELISAEAPGEGADRLAPRVSETAKRLWLVYGILTVAETAALRIAGLGFYDSVAHAFTVVSTGGFSPFPNSILGQSLAVEIVLQVGMIICALNFNLHWFLLGERDWRRYRESWELRFFLKAMLLGVMLVTAVNVRAGNPFGDSLRHGTFNVVSLSTSTGFGTVDFVTWPAAAQLVLMILMLIGASTGSTSGGIKMLRVAVLLRHASRGIRLARQPHAVIPIRRHSETIPETVVSRMAGFVLLYFLLALAGSALLITVGLGPEVGSTQIVTSVGAAVSALGNMGPGFGAAGPHSSFAVFNPVGRVILAMLMLIGRLEVFPVLLMFAASARSLRRRHHR